MNSLQLVPIVLAAIFAINAIGGVVLCVASRFVKPSDLAEANGEQQEEAR